MFGSKKKSIPEKIVAKIGDMVDGHVVTIAKKFGTGLTAAAALAVGASAFINTVREDDDE